MQTHWYYSSITGREIQALQESSRIRYGNTRAGVVGSRARTCGEGRRRKATNGQVPRFLAVERLWSYGLTSD